MTTTKDNPAVQAWRDKNPLRKWLDRPPKRGKLGQFCEAVQRTRQAVFGWLHGTHMPDMPTFAKITGLTGITVEQWMRWFNKNPSTNKDGSDAWQKTDSRSRSGSGAAL